MPVLAYFVVVGSLLFGVLYVAAARFEPPASLSVRSEFHGLPARWKTEPSEILAVTDIAPSDLLLEKDTPSALQRHADPAKKTKHAHILKKPRPPAKTLSRRGGARSRYAGSVAPPPSYASVW